MRINSVSHGVHTTMHKKNGTRKMGLNKKGQQLIEYAVVVGIITAAVVAMSTYVFRSVQATQQLIQEEYTTK